MAATRILTTHVGSLPRPQEVVDQLFAEDQGTLADRDTYARVMRANVAAVVKKQVEAGVDVVSDGEMSKISYATYIRHRLTGFEIGEMPRAVPRDLDDFPDYKERLAKLGATPRYHRPICCAPISVRTLEPLRADLANLQAAAAAAGATRAFMNAASPGVIAVFQPNRHYATQEAYIGALADAMRPEYEAIVAAGFDLQIDAPDIAMGRHIRFRDVDDAEFLRNAHLQIDALNHALANVDPARVRMHICWGNYDGPHHYDVPLETIMPVVLKARAGTYVFEASNPRHAHEWEVWQATAIPEDKILAPGVIDSVCNFIEHPRLVAQRLLRFADIVGRERVMAASDCGFGTFAGFGAVHPPIAYAKLKAMAEGAAMASDKLWGRA
ncbi:MAG: cobalamin-independent methionine synthase II family protein [Burkholderiales bacterium]|nr:cobalamin-independent methionine synthase II family protein [Burkholderiales bacterium]